MTDKQIIIDGIDVSRCAERSMCINCETVTNCYYKQLKRKEQECERLKEKVEDFQIVKDHMKYQGFETLSEFLLSETVANECNKQLDQLKQTFTEIKEIAEICKCHNADGCYECKYFDDCEVEDEEIPTRDVCKLILQKISECEGNDEQL